MLARAKRPLLLPGRVGRSIEAWNDRIALAELLDARVLTDLKTAAAFPTGRQVSSLTIRARIA